MSCHLGCFFVSQKTDVCLERVCCAPGEKLYLQRLCCATMLCLRQRICLEWLCCASKVNLCLGRLCSALGYVMLGPWCLKRPCCALWDEFVAGKTMLCLKRRAYVSKKYFLRRDGEFVSQNTMLCTGRLCVLQLFPVIFDFNGQISKDRRHMILRYLAVYFMIFGHHILF